MWHFDVFSFLWFIEALFELCIIRICSNVPAHETLKSQEATLIWPCLSHPSYYHFNCPREAGILGVIRAFILFIHAFGVMLGVVEKNLVNQRNNCFGSFQHDSLTPVFHWRLIFLMVLEKCFPFRCSCLKLWRLTFIYLFYLSIYVKLTMIKEILYTKIHIK